MEKYDVSDSSDWLGTRLIQFAPLDAALRCEVCKDYYNTPMITSCAHTFCSLCIRRTLAADGKCPACRSGDQASKLRRNGAVEELVERFKAARPAALKLAQGSRDGPDESRTAATSRSKRKAVDAELEDVAERSSQKRKTRSQSRNDGLSQQLDTHMSDDAKDEDYQPEDDLVPCPICNKRMKAEAVFSHLDRCEEEQEQERRRTRTRLVNSLLIIQDVAYVFLCYRTPKSTTPVLNPLAPNASSKPPERIAELSYGLLTEKALKKKLSDLGIPAWGTRALLIRRHTEWVNLWNANADSTRPRLKRDLLSQLDTWERTQGGHAPNLSGASNGPTGVMRKDFDGAAWAQNNKSDFDRLIAAAREKRKNPDQGQQETGSKDDPDNTTSVTTPNHKAFNSDEASNPSSRPIASSTPPYLKHEDSLERVKQKVHGSHGNTDTCPPSLSPQGTTRSTKRRDTGSSNQSDGLTREELFRAEERRASVSTFAPMPVDGEKIPMFQMQQHPVKDVDRDTTV